MELLEYYTSAPYIPSMRAIPLDRPKACTKCGIVKELSEFYFRSNRPGRLDSACKDCKNKDAMRWGAVHPAERNHAMKTWRDTHKSTTKYKEQQHAVWEKMYQRDLAAGGRICNTCQERKSLSEFYRVRKDKEYRHLTCKPCIKKANYEYGRSRYYRLRAAVLAAYGGQCSCCGEAQEKFLALDHINNDGHKDCIPSGKRRSSVSLYGKLVKLGFPKDNYQLLCHNCNLGKHLNRGICPHKEAV